MGSNDNKIIRAYKFLSVIYADTEVKTFYAFTYLILKAIQWGRHGSGLHFANEKTQG